jgi:hypothetical protein
MIRPEGLLGTSKEAAPPLRPTTPKEIISYINFREETAISVQIAHDGGKISVPDYWSNGGGL